MEQEKKRSPYQMLWEWARAYTVRFMPQLSLRYWELCAV